MRAFYLSLLFVIVAACASVSDALFLPGCWDEEDIAVEAAACRDAGGVWGEDCDGSCIEERPVRIGCCRDVAEPYTVCTEECV